MNIFDVKNIDKTKEIVEMLKENENVRIEKIISTGQTTDWMEQEQEEFVMLIQGEAIIEYKNKKQELSAGDTVIIKKNEKHRVVYTSENPCCIWICVFYD